MSYSEQTACCADALSILRSSRFATEGLKRDLRDEVEFRQARLNAQSKTLRGSVTMYGRDAAGCLREGNEALARQLVRQKLAMEQRVARISTHWGVLESVRASLQPGVRRCLEDVDTCRMIIAKAQASSELAVRRPGDDDVDGVDEAAVDAELTRLRKLAVGVGVGAGVVTLAQAVACEKSGDIAPGSLKLPAKEGVLIDLRSGSDNGSDKGSDSHGSSDEAECTGGRDERGGSSDSDGASTPPRSPTPPKNRNAPLDVAAALRKAE